MRRRPVPNLLLDHDLPVQRFSLLAAMFAVSASLCVVAWAMGGTSQVQRILAVAAVIGVAAAAGLWWGRRRGRHRWVLQAGLLLYSVMVAVVATQSSTVVGIVTLGPAVIMACAYAGYFFPRPAMGAQMAVAISSYTAAAALAEPPVSIVAILTTVIPALALAVVLHSLTNRLRYRSLYDSLTGAISRAAWLKIATGEVLNRSDKPLTVAMIDLDRFKRINDTLGHLAGDHLLRTLTDHWNEVLHSAALLGRFGGDEFVILFPDTDHHQAALILQQLRRAHPAPWTVGTASARPGEELPVLLARADHHLHLAKDR